MRKVIASIITMIVLLTMMTINSYAASMSASNNASSSTKVGDTVTVTVNFPVPVGTAYFNVTYPTSILEYTGGSNTGSITYSYIDSTFQNKTISSAKFTFKVKAEGSATVSIGTPELSDVSGNPVSASKTSTTVTIKKQEATTPANSGSSTPATSTPASSGNTSKSSTTNNTKAATSKNTSNTKKNETPVQQVEEPVVNEVINEVVNEEVSVNEEVVNEVNEIVVTNNSKEEKEKIEINYSKLFLVVAITVITITAIGEAIIIGKKSGKRSK